ncbi:MAG: type II toxin-antitoxin system PemK/MazF family toxin [Mariprofundaceae bacterium]|nr:type II toxin-antitoxin system PemK/MazF family toxin [Mariprofundaceae bacterium]
MTRLMNSKRKIKRGEIWWVSLDPTQGSEIKKTRPCLVLSHDTINELRKTVIVIPLSSAAKSHPPISVPISCQGKQVVAIIDQVRAVAKHRLKNRIEVASDEYVKSITNALFLILQ